MPMFGRTQFKSAKREFNNSLWEFRTYERDENGYPTIVVGEGNGEGGPQGDGFKSKIILKTEAEPRSTPTGKNTYELYVTDIQVQLAGIGAEIEPLNPFRVRTAGLAAEVIRLNEYFAKKGGLVCSIK